MSFYSDPLVTLYLGDCLEVMRELPAESVDAVVTDPPYGLEFMGKEWDGPALWDKRPNGGAQSGWVGADGSRREQGFGRPGPTYRAGAGYQAWCEQWAREAFRVAKPGAYLLAFGGTRTVHRLASAIEDAGWEIRDELVWIYASGFPKSLDVSKALDKVRDDWADIEEVVRFMEGARKAARVSRAEVEDHFGTVNIGQAFFTLTPGSKPRVPRWDQWLQLKELLHFGDSMDAEVWRLNGRKGKPGEAYMERPEADYDGRPGMAASWTDGKGWNGNEARGGAGVTDLARKWDGWGTALKPAHEPIVMARKPLVGTVAANVTRYGTGALNIGATRIGIDPAKEGNNFDRAGKTYSGEAPRYQGIYAGGQTGGDPTSTFYKGGGRWPSNVLLSDATLFDDPNPSVIGSGQISQDGVAVNHNKTPGEWSGNRVYGARPVVTDDATYGGGGGYSRFFRVPERYNETCVRCGIAVSAGSSSSPESRPASSAPSDAATSPAGTLEPTAPATKATTGPAITTPETATSTSSTSSTSTTATPPSKPPETSPASTPPSSPAKSKDAASPEIVTTTTTPSRWMCATCAAATTSPTTSDSDELRNYPFAYLIPKSPRAERERGLADAPKREWVGQMPKNDPDYVRADGVARSQNVPRANVHPTVKPIDLMRHLVRLVTPPGGVCLDPFLGSGTTCLAASEEGFRSIGIEREAEYLDIAKARLMATPMGLGLDVPAPTRRFKEPGKYDGPANPDASWFHSPKPEDDAA